MQVKTTIKQAHEQVALASQSELLQKMASIDIPIGHRHSRQLAIYDLLSANLRIRADRQVTLASAAADHAGMILQTKADRLLTFWDECRNVVIAEL